MSNSQALPDCNRSTPRPRVPGRIVLACFLGLGLAACSDESKETSSDQTTSSDRQVTTASTSSSAVFDAALEKTPCDIAPKEMVAKLFNVPAGQIEVTSDQSSSCGYQWGKNEEMLEVALDVEVFDTAEAASSSFRGVTRGISSKEVSKAMQEAAAQAGDGAAKQIAGLVGGKGLQFEDVEGVGDEARFGTRFGTLYVRQGNLQFSLSAYHGLSMKMPEKFTPDAIMQASEAWRKDTVDERKQQSTELAKAIVAAL